MFTKDSRREQFLTLLGADWTYCDDNSLEELTPSWDNENLGRSKARVEEAMLEYGSRMETGSAAPAPILRPTDRGKDILDGMQSLGGFQIIGGTRFPAYIVKTASDVMANTIRIMANHILNGGHAPTSLWTKRQAIQHLVNSGGKSLEEIARLGGWKQADVEEEKDYLDWSFAIRSIGGPEEINKGIVLHIQDNAKMDDLRQAPKPIVAFVQDLKTGRFSNGDSKPHIESFFAVNHKKGKLHDQFSKNLATFREDPEVKTRLEDRCRTRMGPDVNLRRALRTVLGITEELAAKKTELLYMDEFFHLLNQIRTNLQAMVKTRKPKVNS